jgi:hypothetical protein
MAWSTPLTAVANATLTAAQWNASVRDNLLETAPAKITAAGQIIAGTAANAVAARAPSVSVVSTSETTTSVGTYVDLATLGPEVSVASGTRAIIFVSARIANNTNATESFASYAVSGASSVAATDSRAASLLVAAANQRARVGIIALETGLTAGTNVFTMKYKVGGASTGTFDARTLAVFPL